MIVERPARVSSEPGLYDGINVAPKAHAFARECRQNVNRSMMGLRRNDGCRHLDKGLADINRRALQRDNFFSGNVHGPIKATGASATDLAAVGHGSDTGRRLIS